MFEVDIKKTHVSEEVGKTYKGTEKESPLTFDKTLAAGKTFSISGTEFGDRKTVTVYPGGRIVINKGGC